ncbi:MAG: GNAT family N-acetyltransferase [bacterium]
MTDFEIIDITPSNIAEYGICGYKDAKKHLELRKKIKWIEEYYPKGLRIKAVIAEDGSYQGMLEYIPGKYTHRPVDCESYMFIHCVFVGFKKDYKGKGYASALLEECINDANQANMSGVAVVTRKGSFMAANDIFLKKGFVSVDKVKPDFELLVLKFNESNPNPKFKDMSPEKYAPGLHIFRSPQCPYTEKNVMAILESTKKMNIEANLIELIDSESAQNLPCAFGTFCIIYNGKVISYHPISNTRFENIMKDLLKS